MIFVLSDFCMPYLAKFTGGGVHKFRGDPPGNMPRIITDNEPRNNSYRAYRQKQRYDKIHLVCLYLVAVMAVADMVELA